MKKYLKKVTPLMLVIVLTISNVATASAATTEGDISAMVAPEEGISAMAAPEGGISAMVGGTWTITDLRAPNGGVIEHPTKIVYMPKSEVDALNDYYVSSSAVKDYLLTAGLTKLTETAAKQILTKYGVNLVPLVGWTIIGIELLSAANDQRMRNSFLDAKNSGSGTIKYVESYILGGGPTAKYEVWGGSYMPFAVDLPYTDGYAVGSIDIGVYDY